VCVKTCDDISGSSGSDQFHQPIYLKSSHLLFTKVT